MKKIVVLLFTGMLAFGSSTSSAVEAKINDNKSTVQDKVEVYYFHFTRRCVTCKAVETEAKKAVETLYTDQVKNGLVEFIEVNLEDADSKTAAEKAKAQGQGLILIKGDKRIDLTRQGFMYAMSNPERFQNELKKAVDSMLASK
jgi:coproporphyrinogen III oxidase-like Fe-S oxidoreductase